MGTKVTEFFKIMDPYNAFPSTPFGVKKKYIQSLSRLEAAPTQQDDWWERLPAAIKFMIVHNKFVIAG
jgi:hypothetical protein